MEKLLIIKTNYSITQWDTESPEIYEKRILHAEKENKTIIQYLLQKYPDIVNASELFECRWRYHAIGVMEDKKRWGGKIIKIFHSTDTFEKYMTSVYEIVQWGYEWNLKRILEEE